MSSLDIRQVNTDHAMQMHPPVAEILRSADAIPRRRRTMRNTSATVKAVVVADMLGAPIEALRAALAITRHEVTGSSNPHRRWPSPNSTGAVEGALISDAGVAWYDPIDDRFHLPDASSAADLESPLAMVLVADLESHGERYGALRFSLSAAELGHAAWTLDAMLRELCPAVRTIERIGTEFDRLFSSTWMLGPVWWMRPTPPPTRDLIGSIEGESVAPPAFRFGTGEREAARLEAATREVPTPILDATSNIDLASLDRCTAGRGYKGFMSAPTAPELPEEVLNAASHQWFHPARATLRPVLLQPGSKTAISLDENRGTISIDDLRSLLPIDAAALRLDLLPALVLQIIDSAGPFDAACIKNASLEAGARTQHLSVRMAGDNHFCRPVRSYDAAALEDHIDGLGEHRWIVYLAMVGLTTFQDLRFSFRNTEVI